MIMCRTHLSSKTWLGVAYPVMDIPARYKGIEAQQSLMALLQHWVEKLSPGGTTI